MKSADPSPGRGPRHRGTVGFLLAAGVFLFAALALGISDNPPGIALLYASGLSLVLTVAHRWREPRKFAWLLLAAFLGFFATAVIHNFAEVGAASISSLPLLSMALSVISVLGFMLAVVVFPSAGLVGLLGLLVMMVRGAPKEG